ncbi:MAG: C_GCAxxG_C_C family protein [Oscillospiraceae bacterium]|nr:C_GCAxxG_C_C family protein [Oscillospiraceae bacterium]
MKESVKKAIYDSGFEFEKQYGGCAQCTLCALKPYLDIDDAVIKSATDLMAGGVRSGNSCGAFNGGLMAIASVTGRSPENMGDKQAVADTLALGRKLFDKFMEEYGTVICRDIQYKIMGKSYRMYDPEDMRRFLADGGHDDKCTDVVAKAAVWVAEILEEAGIREFK